MPKLWNETIDAHRRAVRDATLDTTAELVAKHGLMSVTMSQIAHETGIGRATLYKYFPDVEAVLRGWHERQIGRHLELFSSLAQEQGAPVVRLERMLEAYAQIVHQHHGSRLAAILHGGGHMAHAKNHLSAFLAAIIADGAEAAEIRDDVVPAELAAFCLSALAGAADLPSKAAVGRLVQLTMSAVVRQP
ncbi:MULTISPECIES: TetR/AcrR family transcriptional regulator [unclassified Devosia]|uniref:TetR/AcrR family transcriptional regulator n=1 Tax=unclassified Devosia TaxID=196773 RepID=UPI00086A65E5|nr:MULTISPECIES: TetR/AcrR family transcriptional regulator [unclassified Devosia]MBN9360753.1 TetR/AcrR family transcriptional regulator [Devosia sp.]ODS87939.1 MAG: TetR family transcriptional regulator [Devosia sp. SCN 66-27]OJX22714.1 MAG: TetR family transcriptional regulator [Devosia sp. 66-14]